MKLFVYSLFVIACAMSDIQSVAAAGQENLVASPQNLGTTQNNFIETTPGQRVLTEAEVRQIETENFRDIDNTVAIIADTLQALFENNQTITFFGSVMHELNFMTHYSESLESLVLLNNAANTVVKMVYDKETFDIVEKSLSQLEAILDNPTKHERMQSIINAAHKIILNNSVKDIKEGALDFLEEIMRDPLKKIAIGEMMLLALQLGQKVETMTMVEDSLSSLKALVENPTLQNTIINTMKSY